MNKDKIIKLNKYSEKCKIINSVQIYETDREVADSIKNIKKNDDGVVKVNSFRVIEK